MATERTTAVDRKDWHEAIPEFARALRAALEPEDFTVAYREPVERTNQFGETFKNYSDYITVTKDGLEVRFELNSDHVDARHGTPFHVVGAAREAKHDPKARHHRYLHTVHTPYRLAVKNGAAVVAPTTALLKHVRETFWMMATKRSFLDSRKARSEALKATLIARGAPYRDYVNDRRPEGYIYKCGCIGIDYDVKGYEVRLDRSPRSFAEFTALCAVIGEACPSAVKAAKFSHVHADVYGGTLELAFAGKDAGPMFAVLDRLEAVIHESFRKVGEEN